MSNYLTQIKTFLDRLSMQQKVSIGSVLVGGIIVFTLIGMWANRPDYTLLFGGLSPSDASGVVESLRERGTDYELRDGGTAVYVPREEVYELRLGFAGSGVVSDGPAGYELFDSGTLGMTDFMQRLNMKRALEGELSRTIASLRQVKVSRVHLVVPERSAFRETQNAASASVVLQMAGSGRLQMAQIEGITSLVAGAVEGMSPNSVTVLDTQGNVLTQPERGEGDSGLSATQLEMQRVVEERLVEKGQSMLDQVLGRGNAIVRVAAALDFSRSVAESEIIDPESATVIAEEKLSETAGETNGAESSIRNYELSRTVERSEKGVGDVEYLTVSVILNQRLAPTVGENEPAVTVPYTGEELAEISSLVQNAVGFSPDRGDRITVHQTEFENSENTALAEEFAAQRQTERLQLLLRYGLILLALGAAFFLLRSAARKAGQVVPQQPRPSYPSLSAAPGGAPALAAAPSAGAAALSSGAVSGAPQLAAASRDGTQGDADIYTAKLSDEAQDETKRNRYEDVLQQATQSPDITAEIVRAWLERDAVEA